jgi:hypothetical protein
VKSFFPGARPDAGAGLELQTAAKKSTAKKSGFIVR